MEKAFLGLVGHEEQPKFSSITDDHHAVMRRRLGLLDQVLHGEWRLGLEELVPIVLAPAVSGVAEGEVHLLEPFFGNLSHDSTASIQEKYVRAVIVPEM